LGEVSCDPELNFRWIYIEPIRLFPVYLVVSFGFFVVFSYLTGVYIIIGAMLPVGVLVLLVVLIKKIAGIIRMRRYTHIRLLDDMECIHIVMLLKILDCLGRAPDVALRIFANRKYRGLFATALDVLQRVDGELYGLVREILLETGLETNTGALEDEYRKVKLKKFLSEMLMLFMYGLVIWFRHDIITLSPSTYLALTFILLFAPPIIISMLLALWLRALRMHVDWRYIRSRRFRRRIKGVFLKLIKLIYNNARRPIAVYLRGIYRAHRYIRRPKFERYPEYAIIKVRETMDQNF